MGVGGITVQHFHHFHCFIARPEASSSATCEREGRARKSAQQDGGEGRRFNREGWAGLQVGQGRGLSHDI